MNQFIKLFKQKHVQSIGGVSKASKFKKRKCHNGCPLFLWTPLTKLLWDIERTCIAYDFACTT